MCVHTHTDEHQHIYRNKHIHVRVHVCLHSYIWTRTHIQKQTQVKVHLCSHSHRWTQTHTCQSACVSTLTQMNKNIYTGTNINHMHTWKITKKKQLGWYDLCAEGGSFYSDSRTLSSLKWHRQQGQQRNPLHSFKDGIFILIYPFAFKSTLWYLIWGRSLNS